MKPDTTNTKRITERSISEAVKFLSSRANRAGYDAVAVFGPPGVGKSSLVHGARLLGLHAIDLELESFDDEAEFVGAAGRQVSDPVFRSCYKVLLLPPRSIYEARRKARDKQAPAKGGQGDYYDDFAKNARRYDFVWTMM